jgi:Fic family protein
MMYEPRFQRTDALIAMIGRIEAVRAVVLRAPIAAQWEFQLRHLEFLLSEPRLTTALYSQWNRVSRATAQRDMADLVDRGVLQRHSVGRGTYYVLPQPDEAQTPPDEA